MAQVKKQIRKAQDLTVLTVAGKISANEIITVLEEFYRGEFTANLLWDCTEADLSQLTRAQLQEVLTSSKQHSRLRQEGKTALVMPDDLGYGIGRMYETLSEVTEHPISLAVFRSMEEAWEWLESFRGKDSPG